MSAGIAVETVSLRLGAFQLKQLSFAVDPGEILVILGPNGAGKSVSLETIAGFHRPETGRIFIGGRDVTARPPEHRKVSLLFQDFGLFPHLSVAQNVAFGLDAHLRTGREVPDLLAAFDISQLAARNPGDLSPGEKQRVALARALARHPDLFLFDEPFSALDARTRDQLRDELLEFLRAREIPALFVTHDREDALALADKILVMRAGSVVQFGAPDDIFRRPADRFVAEFVGIENVLAGAGAAGKDGLRGIAIGERTLYSASAAGGAGPVRVCIRAEDIGLWPAGGAPASARQANRFAARIVGTKSLGVVSRVELDCGFRLNAFVMTRQLRDMQLGRDAAVDIAIDAAAIHVISDQPP
jgi:ABC-type Fe3+/spermidine/putrescine transport system ATPase subunit